VPLGFRPENGEKRRVIALVPKRKPLSILVVEEDLLQQAALRRMLEADGHRVVKSCDRHQAAPAIRQEAFDLLIIDVLFPGPGTIEAVVERSRAEGPIPSLGLCRFARILPDYYLLLTAKLGMRVILAKPFDQAQLTEAIAEVFAGPGAWLDGACSATA
jgi:CheY-like chemotaxis protein